MHVPPRLTLWSMSGASRLQSPDGSTRSSRRAAAASGSLAAGAVVLVATDLLVTLSPSSLPQAASSAVAHAAAIQILAITLR